jgi:hypothetical protein
MADKSDHLAAAEKLLAKLPKAVRDGATLEEGGGEYTLLKFGGRTVASIRPKNVRITVGHDGTTDAMEAIAPTVAEAATSRPALKTPEEREAEREAKREAKEKEREEAKAKKEAEKEAKKKEKEEADAAKAEAEAEKEEGE